MLNGEKCIRCREYFKFEELTPGSNGYGLCPDCVVKTDPHEKKRFCPNDEKEMKKEVLENLVVIDRCEVCGGVWLDADEIGVLQEVAARNADNLAGAPFQWTTLLNS
ncbi:MAG TPA: zf-TFIIB domain-containing protein [Pyrinomonadaceae bacterium]|nr:zf-TFIIB domain-containing protein [Pyrinomonadaceae bacterium]